MMKQTKLQKNFLILSKKRDQNKLEELMKGSQLVFDNVNLLHYKCHKINLNCGGSLIDFPGWVKNKSNNKSYQ